MNRRLALAVTMTVVGAVALTGCVNNSPSSTEPTRCVRRVGTVSASNGTMPMDTEFLLDVLAVLSQMRRTLDLLERAFDAEGIAVDAPRRLTLVKVEGEHSGCV